MREVALRVLAVVLLCVAWTVAGFWAGLEHAKTRALAEQAQAQRAAALAYESEVREGNGAASEQVSQQRQLEANYADLDKRYRALLRRTPLVARCTDRGAVGPGAAVVPGVADGAPGVDVGAPGAPSDGAAAGVHAGAAVVSQDAAAAGLDGGVALTLAAVRVWNGALSGTDAAAGACGADGAATAADAAACAADSGLTLADAWDNHRANAATCAADRLRHQALIDFIKRRESAGGPRP